MQVQELQYQPLTPHMNRADPRFRHQDCKNLFDVYEEYYQKKGFHPPWHAYLLVNHEEAVGVCGFTGPPSGGRVELAYYIFKAYEGQGYGTKACAMIVEYFNEIQSDLILFARTAPELNASTNILIINQFKFSSMVQDHEIGDAWEWVYEPKLR